MRDRDNIKSNVPPFHDFFLNYFYHCARASGRGNVIDAVCLSD